MMNLGGQAGRRYLWPVARRRNLSDVPAPLAATDRASRDASITLGLTLPGDTVLYLLLPLHAAAFGISLPEAGLLLAANRLVRIAGYGWVARGYHRFGPRAACLAASIGAAAATLGYATLSGVFWLLLARLLWGLSFAALNIATQALATAEVQGSGRRSGRSRAIISAGPMSGLLAAGALAEVIGPRFVFLGLGAIALIALPVAVRLPGGEGQRLAASGRRVSLPSPLDVWAFVQGLTLDGVFVVGLSLLAAAVSPESATLAAGVSLAMRYMAEIVLGPPGGSLAERLGAKRALITVTLVSAAAYAAIGGGAVWIGVIGVVLLRGVAAPLPALVAAIANPGAGRVPAIAGMATWRDLGAAVGPLVAGFVLPIAPMALYVGAAILLAVATLALALLQATTWRPSR
jgi:MFS transporter, DHA1 family, inner membrane transport protein